MLRRVSVVAVRAKAVLAACCSLLLIAVVVFSIGASDLRAQTRPAGYAEAERAFTQFSLDQRIRLQILLTAAGYWPAVPNENFSSRIFDAISRFQMEKGLSPDGILSPAEMEQLNAQGGPLLNQWGFQTILHPTGPFSIWVPFGIGLNQEATSDGLKYTDTSKRLTLTFDYFPHFTVRRSFDALINDLTNKGYRVGYSKVYRDDFFVASVNSDATDGYVRYHRYEQGGLGFSLFWSHDAIELHGDRIATIISGSLWSSVTGAPFTAPFTVHLPASALLLPIRQTTPRQH
jgi:serine protease Do